MNVLIVSLILLIGAVALSILLFRFPDVMMRFVWGVTVFLVDAVLWVWYFPRLIVGRIRKLRQKQTV